MSGLPVVLGADRWPNTTTMQGPGHGHRVAADRLREAMRAEPGLRDRLLLYAQAMSVQAAQTAVANGQNTIGERLARWLLMCDDRVDGSVIDLTHEFLAIMLGVRRAGVTVAMHVLEGQQLIRAKRARIEVLDREGLERAANGSYGVAEAEYARLLRARASAGADPGGTPPAPRHPWPTARPPPPRPGRRATALGCARPPRRSLRGWPEARGGGYPSVRGMSLAKVEAASSEVDVEPAPCAFDDLGRDVVEPRPRPPRERGLGSPREKGRKERG
jgi:hypothetical protein